MKKRLIVTCLISGIAFFGLWYAYVKNYGIHLTPEEFIERAGNRDDAGSMYSLSFGGIRNGRAYLSSWKMGRAPEEILYWTEINGLPDETKSEMLAGTGRWELRRHGKGVSKAENPPAEQGIAPDH